MKIFISSTFEDLKPHRKKVINDLMKAGYETVSMELFSANSKEPKDFSLEKVKECDLFILLVGFRRGYIPDGETQSITQLEYQCASENGLGILVYKLKEDSNSLKSMKKLDERRKKLLYVPFSRRRRCCFGKND